MNSIRRTVLNTFITAIVIANVGCAMLQEPSYELPNGTPISIEDIPANVVAPASLPAGTKAQRYGDSGTYRLDYPDGEIRSVGPYGTMRGGIL